MRSNYLFGLAILGGAGLLSAADRPTAKQFDKDRDGRLGAPEFARFAAAIAEPKLKDVDQNGDLTVSEAELVKWSESYSLDTEFSPQVETIPFDNAEQAVPPEEEKPWALGKLRLRKDHQSIIQKEFPKAEPATATFYRDNNTHNDTWAIEAALGYVDKIGAIEGKRAFGGYTYDPLEWVVSAGVNRIDGPGDGSLTEADAVSLRAGLVLGLQGDESAFWQYQVFSLAYKGTTDTHFDSYVNGVEASWEPIRNMEGELGINGPYRKGPFNLMHYRFAFIPKLELGETPAGVPGEDDAFLKVGPTQGLYIYPFGWDRFEMFASYSYRWEVLGGDSEDFDYWEIGSRLKLDEAGQAYLEAKYRLGTLPEKFSHIDVTQFGIGIKF